MTTQEFDFSIDLLQALIWQYNDAENLQDILKKKQDWLDENHKKFWEDWFRDVFDLRTANEFGCAVWSIILVIKLTPTLPLDNRFRPIFGFGSFRKNFNNGNFFRNTDFVELSTAQKRIVLQLRYRQLVSAGTIPEINFALATLFGKENAYVLDTETMDFVTYLFTTGDNQELRQILDNFDVLPRPAAVGTRYKFVSKTPFGFGQFKKNFNNGNFGGK